MVVHKRKRGRPAGAKTKSATPGKKRAREFMDSLLDGPMRPTKAAETIATRSGCETFQIFKDKKRHQESIVTDAWAEADQAKRDYEEMLAADIGPCMPTDARLFLAWIFINALKGQRI